LQYFIVRRNRTKLNIKRIPTGPEKNNRLADPKESSENKRGYVFKGSIF